MAGRHELTDEQSARIKDLIPGKEGDPGRTGEHHRRFVNAVLFVLKTGIPWDDLPGRYGKPNPVWKRFDRWCAHSVWEELFHAIGEPELEEDLEEVPLGSTTIKAPPWPPAVAAQQMKKRVGRRAAWPRPLSRRIDHQGACGDGQDRTTGLFPPHARPTRRCSAGRDAAGGS